MKQRYKLPRSVIEKNVGKLCFMVETNVTCMEVVEPREIFIHPMGYEVEK